MQIDKEEIKYIDNSMSREHSNYTIIQEPAELSHAFANLFRGREGAIFEVVEEIADTLIVIEMIKERYGIHDFAIQSKIDSKMERNMRRAEARYLVGLGGK